MIVSYFAPMPAPDEARAALARLPRWRRERAEKFNNEAAFGRSVGAGLLYAHALRRAGLDPERAVVFLDAGKPVFAAADAWFSLSHSGAYVLCALADAPVGADIQEPRPVRLSMARRFCAAESEALHALPPEAQTDSLLRLWCRKEAWVKAESDGRLLRLDEYNVLSPDGRWRFSDFSLPDGLFAALCAREAAAEPLFVSKSELLKP